MSNNSSNINRSASTILTDLTNKDPDLKTSIKEIVDTFGANSFALVMIFFSIPVAVPIPYPPGFTLLFGLPLMIFSFQLIFNYEAVKLPKAFENYKIKNSTLIKICSKIIPVLKKIEKGLKPRYAFVKTKLCTRLIGILSLFCAAFIASPFPFTHTIPAWGISIMCLGLFELDGLVIIIGYIIAIIGNITSLMAVYIYWYLVKKIWLIVVSYFN